MTMRIGIGRIGIFDMMFPTIEDMDPTYDVAFDSIYWPDKLTGTLDDMLGQTTKAGDVIVCSIHNAERDDNISCVCKVLYFINSKFGSSKFKVVDQNGTLGNVESGEFLLLNDEQRLLFILQNSK